MPSSTDKVQGALEFNSLKNINQTPLQLSKFGLICTSTVEQHLEVHLWADSYQSQLIELETGAPLKLINNS